MTLTVDRVTVRFGDLVAVDQVSLTVARGETLGLVGPSGCGKSTLLRVIAGLLAPDDGTIGWESRDLTAVPPEGRDVGFVFQSNALFNHRSVGENVGFGLKMAGWDRPARNSRVAQLLEMVGLGGFEHRMPETLSGGEAQRVALARALAPEPGLLLLDEPFAALDRLRRDEVTADVVRLLRDLEQTAIFVTHDQHEAFRVADRLAVMRAGALVRTATPPEVWSDPQSAFVARFIGHGPLIDHRGRRVAVRPDAVTFEPVKPTDGGQVEPDAPIAGTVTEVTFAGDRYQVQARVGTDLYRGFSNEPLVVGQPVGVELDPDKLAVLDRD